MDKKLAVMSKGYVPDNSKKNTKWALKVLRNWKTTTNVCCGKEGKPVCPNDLLESPDVKEVNFRLSRFVAEVCNRKGEPYPPRSIHQILARIHTYILEKNPTIPKLLDKHKSCLILN